MVSLVAVARILPTLFFSSFLLFLFLVLVDDDVRIFRLLSRDEADCDDGKQSYRCWDAGSGRDIVLVQDTYAEFSSYTVSDCLWVLLWCRAGWEVGALLLAV